MRRLAGAVAGAAVAGLIWWLPAFDGLAQTGRATASVLALGAVFWAAEVLNTGVTALLVLGLLLCAGVPASTALSGFGSPAWWILVSVLYLGTAMERSGLARRLAYRILLLFRPTYGGILSAFCAIGFVLMIGIPSMTVRTAIMVPIAWALVQALPLERPGRGAALIVFTAFEMAVLPGTALLTGALWGPYIAGLFASSGIALSWLEYARIMALPTLAWCALVVAGNRLALSPRSTVLPHRELLRAEMAGLGPPKSAELATAGVVSVSVLAWASQPWHRLPAEAIGMLAFVALFALGVLKPADIGSGIPWPLAIFVGGMLGLTQAITAYGINKSLAALVVPALEPFTHNAFAFVIALGAAIAVIRLIEPGGFITIAAFFLALLGAATPLSRAPLALAGAILLPVHVFWFSYQNIWMVMTDGITAGKAYSTADRLRFAAVFFVATLAALLLAAAYWRWLGVL
ncbi:MAG: SLC13 family permease [Bryobacteraceae bacterium]